MTHELNTAFIQPSGSLEELHPPPLPPEHSQEMTAPTDEQARAVEAVFAQQEKESETVAGLLGMYTGAVMLHNLAVDTFTPEVEEVKRMPKLKSEGAD